MGTLPHGHIADLRGASASTIADALPTTNRVHLLFAPPARKHLVSSRCTGVHRNASTRYAKGTTGPGRTPRGFRVRIALLLLWSVSAQLCLSVWRTDTLPQWVAVRSVRNLGEDAELLVRAEHILTMPQLHQQAVGEAGNVDAAHLKCFATDWLHLARG